MPPMSGIAESLNTLPEPIVTAARSTAPDHVDAGLDPIQPG